MKQAAEDPSSGSQQLAKLISFDPVLAGRIVQVANSPMFMGLEKVDSIATSIARLGIHCIRNLVTSFALVQIYNYKNLSSYKKQLKSVWQFSTYVAAISEVIAKRYKHIEHTEALMAGLMHNIGVLPALIKCTQVPMLKENPVLMSRVVHELQGNLGSWILKEWSLNDDLIALPLEVTNPMRSHDGRIDMADIVLMSKLHAARGSQHPWSQIPWKKLPVFQRLGMGPEESIQVINQARKEISDVMHVLQASI